MQVLEIRIPVLLKRGTKEPPTKKETPKPTGFTRVKDDLMRQVGKVDVKPFALLSGRSSSSLLQSP